MIRVNKISITPAQVIIGGFLLLILAGAILLALPVSAQSGQATPFMDALFTSTSATCVTGLVIHDTASYWSIFGQVVILLLIQAGGMGVVTMAVAVSVLTGRKIGLRQRTLMQESISAPHMGGIVRLTKFILTATLLLEGAGALLLSLRFIPVYGLARGIWYAVFHAVSAFCNAGFDLMGTSSAPYSSLTGWVGDPVVSLTIPALIAMGGLGFFVWDDLRRSRLRVRGYALQTKVVLTTTALLILLPALFFYFGEFGRGQWADLAPGERALASLFQSVTPRTAGFNTVDQTRLSSPAVLLTTLLMVVGGSPGSTAGGVKTTALAVMVLCVVSTFKKRTCIQCFQRRVNADILRSVVSLVFLYVCLLLTGAVLIATLDGVGLTAALFEAASAIGTVGLSLSLTPVLGPASRVVLMLLMYFGRVGCLTLLCIALDRQPPAPAQLPQENLIIG